MIDDIRDKLADLLLRVATRYLLLEERYNVVITKARVLAVTIIT